jgi:hypothetical protein
VGERIRVKVDAEEGAFPVWMLDGHVDDIDELVSDALRSRLQNWCDDVCGVRGALTPPRPPRLTKAEAWNRRGRLLATELQAELGEGYEVFFVNAETRRLEAVERLT